MNEKTKQIIGDMSKFERQQYNNHRGMVDFIETIRPKKESTHKERRAEYKDNPQDRC